MTMIREILHATDFSSCSRQAFDVAVELARLYRAELRIVHVLVPLPPIAMQPLVFVPPPEDAYEEAIREARRGLDELAGEAERRGADADVQLIERETAAPALVDTAQGGVDLVVMGTHGRRGSARLLFGSVAHQVARLSPCPVLTVRERESAEHPCAVPRRILVPFDFSAPARSALLWAASLARRCGAEIRLLHVLEHLPIAAGEAAVIESEEDLAPLLRDHEQRLADAAAWLAAGVPAVLEVRIGRPASEIVDRANDGSIDWVVMSTRGLTGVKRLMFGSTAEEVVRLADAPVLLVNPECPQPAREDAPAAASVPRIHDGAVAAPAPRRLAMRVSDLMHRNPQTATPGMSLQRAGRLMAEADCGFLPIVGPSGDVVGVLTDRDICLALATRNRAPSEVQIRHVITGDAWACRAEDELRSALQIMAAQRVRRLPVVDQVGRLIGILSLDDVLAETRESDDTGRPSYAEVAETLKAICTRPVPALR